jgi:hypothetical protein
MSFGPVEIPFSLSWDEFLEAVANTVDGCRDAAQLITASFTWRFSSPVKGIRLGLKNDTQLFHLIKQVKQLKASASPAQRLVVLEMEPPRKITQAVVSPSKDIPCSVSHPHQPWSADAEATASGSGPAVDEDIVSDEEGPMSKKVCVCLSYFFTPLLTSIRQSSTTP